MEEIEGEEGGGPTASRAVGGKRLAMWRGGKLGAREEARGVREGGELRQDPGTAGADYGR
jgi:hypothetical protein